MSDFFAHEWRQVSEGAALKMAAKMESGMVLDLSELPPEVDMLSLGRHGYGLWAATITRFDGCYARTEDGRGSTPSEAFHAALDAWRKR